MCFFLFALINIYIPEVLFSSTPSKASPPAASTAEKLLCTLIISRLEKGAAAGLPALPFLCLCLCLDKMCLPTTSTYCCIPPGRAERKQLKILHVSCLLIGLLSVPAR